MGTVSLYVASVGLLVTALAIHEAGHLVVHKLVGLPVRCLWIGLPCGKLRATFHLRNLPVHITPLLFGAGVDVKEEVWWEASFWKRILVSLYGPAFNFITVLLLCILFPTLGGVQLGAAMMWAGVSAPWRMVSMYGDEALALSDVSGPVGVVEQGTRCIAADPLRGAFFWFLLLSVSLGGVNLVPLPALDGGQVLVSVLKKLGLPLSWAKTLTKTFLVLFLVVLVLLTGRDLLQLATR